MAERIFFEKRHGRSSILALNIFPVDVSKSAMNKFIPYLQFGKINCLLCHVSKYGEYEMLHQSEDPKRKEINMIFENSVIRISNFFSNPSNSFKEGFARKIKSTAPTSSKCISFFEIRKFLSFYFSDIISGLLFFGCFTIRNISIICF